MKILIVYNVTIPVSLYGGVERVIWCLGKELAKKGHRVSYLVKKGSYCDFATIIPIDDTKDIISQIPAGIDIVHFNNTPDNLYQLKVPYVITLHGNSNYSREFDLNTVFISKNHAHRHGSESYVYNGLDWDEYSKPDLSLKRNYFHFIGNAAWRVKNVQGAIDIILAMNQQQLHVMGGVRFNFKMGLRFTFSTRIRFYGMIGGVQKDKLLNGSKGLIFPVRWHEPFGLAIIESLYFGCPVFGTPYGSLPEIVNSDVGYLSAKKTELFDAVSHVADYSNKHCHEYAVEEFNSAKMADAYCKKYEQVLSNLDLNTHRPYAVGTEAAKLLFWE
ncbi:MAG: glycosyltransferase [Saprospiraceae bacterium]|nr:glycosyltransferase [Saprospiraceae bacterium]